MVRRPGIFEFSEEAGFSQKINTKKSQAKTFNTNNYFQGWTDITLFALSDGEEAAIYRNEKYDYETSLELNVDVILDLDDKGMPSAFEFLNASKLFKVKASSLNSIKEINVSVSITEKLIELNTELTVLVMDEFSQKYLFNMAANCYSIPEFNEVLSFA